MTIYAKRINYRKIYETNYGPIPFDNEGRRYDIHHIDNDHTNNDPTNLKAVTLQEHYDIHWEQGQWTSCLLISKRMKISPEEKSKLVSLSNKERVANGTHHFAGNTNPTYARLANGTHHFLGGEMQTRTVRDRVANGTHHLLGGEIQKRTSKKRMEEGTHHLLKVYVCPHCKKEGQGMIMARWHGDNCKYKGLTMKLSEIDETWNGPSFAAVAADFGKMNTNLWKAKGTHIADIEKFKVIKYNNYYSIWDNEILVAYTSLTGNEVDDVWVNENYRGQKVFSKLLWFYKSRLGNDTLMLGKIRSPEMREVVKGLSSFNKKWKNIKTGDEAPFDTDTSGKYYSNAGITDWRVVIENNNNITEWLMFNEGLSFIKESYSPYIE